MVRIFKLTQQGVEPNENVFQIPELRKITETYPDYMPALSYVAYMSDPTEDNIYGNLEEEDRKQILLLDFPGSYSPTDEVICKALHKLELLNDTTVNKYYRQARSMISKLGNYLETSKIDDSKEGNLSHIRGLVKEVGTVYKQFAEAEKLKLEEEAKRKGKKPTLY